MTLPARCSTRLAGRRAPSNEPKRLCESWHSLRIYCSGLAVFWRRWRNEATGWSDQTPSRNAMETAYLRRRKRASEVECRGAAISCGNHWTSTICGSYVPGVESKCEAAISPKSSGFEVGARPRNGSSPNHTCDHAPVRNWKAARERLSQPSVDTRATFVRLDVRIFAEIRRENLAKTKAIHI